MDAPGEVLGLSADDHAAVLAALAELDDEAGQEFASIYGALAQGSDLLHALGLPAGTIDLLYSQAFARFEARRFPEAMQLFQALTLLAPKVKDHWLGLGICLRMAEQDEAAQLVFDVAVALAPDDPAVLFHRTELACHRQNWAAARSDAERFEALPDTPTHQRLAGELQRFAVLARARG